MASYALRLLAWPRWLRPQILSSTLQVHELFRWVSSESPEEGGGLQSWEVCCRLLFEESGISDFANASRPVVLFVRLSTTASMNKSFLLLLAGGDSSSRRRTEQRPDVDDCS